MRVFCKIFDEFQIQPKYLCLRLLIKLALHLLKAAVQSVEGKFEALKSSWIYTIVLAMNECCIFPSEI